MTALFNSLKSWPPDRLAQALSCEHPQLCTALIASMPSDLRAVVLSFFSTHLRNEVLLRLATSDSLTPLAEQLLRDTVLFLKKNQKRWLAQPIFGLVAAAETCATLSGDQCSQVLDCIQEYDPDCGELLSRESQRLRILNEQALLEKQCHRPSQSGFQPHSKYSQAL